MRRLASILCILLILLCPFVCMTTTAAEEAGLDRDCDEVCEVIAVGAVVGRLDGDAAAQNPSTWLDVLPSPFLLASPARPSSFAIVEGGSARPPSTAMRRQALLQTFLF
ncbi:hypothetical protein [Paludisphaera mucosa]|uniref:Secreted protein n=1 Tax=Paludisphaera mucosa TaxID=3030827 RepID=A0ABT6FBV1_9BACT|nr:hypothetical protein [Paludisphaera mucosa]MDG3004858.1 hypothetical protein [Paludisphaera mucosa]